MRLSLRLGLVVASVIAVVLLASGGTPALGGGEDLQAMIDRTEAGSVLELSPGTYRGGVRIDKPLVVRGTDWPVVDGGGEGSVFVVESPDVTIEGLVIRGTGDSLDRENSGISSDRSPRLVIKGNRFEDVLFGVFLRTSPDSVVSGNVVGAKDLDPGRRGDGIRLWESPRSLVEANTVAGGRDTVLWFTDEVEVRDNLIEGGRYGLHFMYSDGALIEGNHIAGNSVGVFLMYSFDVQLHGNVMADNYGPSGYGIGLKDMDGVTASGNRVVGNRVGLYLDNSPSAAGVEQTFEHNVFAYNGIGVLFQPSVRNNNFFGNAFVDNGEQVGIQGTGAFSGNTWTRNGVGNYWSDFAGYDADGDGIGDVPYRSTELYSELTDVHPELRFFAETPAARAVDVAARLFPVFRPRPRLEDTAPLIRPPALEPLVAAGDGPTPGVLITAVALIGGAAGVALIGGRSRRLAI